MFESIGRKGRTKKLSPLRWFSSIAIAAGLIGGGYGGYNRIQAGPSVDDDATKEDQEVVFTVTLPPPPPPPPAPVPKQTTKPRRNTISKKVEQKEIKAPEPTPPPPKDQPTPTPEAEVEDSGGVEGGVVGGVIGGVIGGVVGGSPSGAATGDIKEIDFGEVKFRKKVVPKYPEIARRNKITSNVMVEVTCDPAGNVIDVRWVSGNEIFKDSAMEAAWLCKYEPQPISFKFRQPFNFKLAN